MTPVPTVAPPLHGPRARDPWFYGWRFVTRTRADGTTFSEQVPLTSEDVLHPQEEDFIVTTAAHDRIVRYLHAVFDWRLEHTPGALVLGDHRVDWQRAGLRPHGPDITVLFESQPWDIHRGTYPVGEMGANPQLVIEVTSPSTRDKDLNEKVTHYARAGIPQYVIVDSREEETGWQVQFLEYRPSPRGAELQLPAEPNRVWLPPLNLWLAAEGDQVVCLLPDGTPVGDFTDAMRKLETLQQQADAERQRADTERQRADTERQRADQEAVARLAAEEQMRLMAAELRRLRGENP